MPLPAYDRAGAGDPLLLVHGLGGERHIWAPVLDHLADAHDVVTVDLPGFGGSPALTHPPPPRPDRLALAIAELLDELGWQRPAIAGNSLGAWVALELAALGRASSVTAIAPAGLWARKLGPKPYVARNAARAVQLLLPLLLRSRRLRGAALAGSFAYPDRVPRAAALRIIRAYAASPGFVPVSNAMRAGRFEAGDRIDVPVTLAWCEHDRLVSRPRTLRLPVTRELLLPDCGHVPMYDDPGLVAQVIREGASLGLRTSTAAGEG